MNFDDVYEWLNAAVLAREGRSLTKVEEMILAGAWHDATYEEIAKESISKSFQEYSVNYLKRDVGPKLWKLLSAAFNLDINKKNFRDVTHQIISSNQQKAPPIQTVTTPALKSHNQPGIPIQEKRATSLNSDLGEAVDIDQFFGREHELEKLEEWILNESSRIVALLGLGGIGKTSLAVKLVKRIQAHFESVIWRSLQDAPSLEKLLADLIHVWSGGEETKAEKPDLDGETSITQLMTWLHHHRCLLIFDKVEAILEPGRRAGRYRQGYEKYGELFKRIGEEAHQSCLLIISREKPDEVALMEGAKLFVQSRKLVGLNLSDAQNIVEVKGFPIVQSHLNHLNSDHASAPDCLDRNINSNQSEAVEQVEGWNQLIEHYGGNPLAIKIAATAIYELFNGDISAFLCQNKTIFDTIYDQIEEQIHRLSVEERTIINWLAISHGLISFAELQQHVYLSNARLKFLGLIKSLKDRSLIEVEPTGFSLQPVIREYLLEKLIEAIFDDIVTLGTTKGYEPTRPLDLNQYALVKANAEEHVIERQLLTLVGPILTKLLTHCGSEDAVKSLLQTAIVHLQQQPKLRVGYAGGNLVNLLRELRVNFDNSDFSNLALWHARFQNLSLRHVNVEHSDLKDASFTETIGDVLSVCISQDGKFVAAGDTEGTIHIWEFASNAKTLMTYRSWRGHFSWIRSVAFSPDDQTLVSGSNDCTVKLWDVKTGQCLRTLPPSKDWVRSVQFNPVDGTMFAIGSDDYSVKLWSVSPGAAPTTLTHDAHMDRVRSVTFSPDGSLLASGGDDRIIILWDVAQRKGIARVEAHTKPIRSIAISPDGQYLASASDDHTVKLWAIATKTFELEATFAQHGDRVRSVAFSPDGQWLVSGGDDCTLNVWDVSTKRCIATLGGNRAERMERIQSIAFKPNSRLLVSGSDNQTLKLWDINRQTCLKTLRGATKSLQALHFLDNDTVLSGCDDHRIQVWDVKTGQCTQTLEDHTGRITSLAAGRSGFSRDRVLASGSDDCTIKLWNLNTGQCVQTSQHSTHWIRSIAFSPNGNVLAVAGDDQCIRLWEVHNGRIPPSLNPMILRGHRHWIRTVQFSPTGQTLASGGDDQNVILWNIHTGNAVTLGKHDHRVQAVVFNSTGELLASASDDATIKLWQVSIAPIIASPSHTSGCEPEHEARLIDTLKLTADHPDSQCGIKSIAFSPDDRWLVGGSEGGTVRLWDVANRCCVQCFTDPHLDGRSHIMGVQSVAFSPDGQTLASSSRDGEIKLWDLQSGQWRRTLTIDGPYAGMNIAGTRGLSESQKAALHELGAARGTGEGLPKER